VGFSFCDKDNAKQDCTHDDNSQSRDTLQAVLMWYDKYPEYKPNDLWLAGESYAGVYIPYLAKQMVHHNELMKKTGGFSPKLKGFAVGNGVTDWLLDNMEQNMDYGYWHNLFDENTRNQLLALNCPYYLLEDFQQPISQNCTDLWNLVANYTHRIDKYFIFGKCYPLQSEVRELMEQAGLKMTRDRYRPFVQAT